MLMVFYNTPEIDEAKLEKSVLSNAEHENLCVDTGGLSTVGGMASIPSLPSLPTHSNLSTSSAVPPGPMDMPLGSSSHYSSLLQTVGSGYVSLGSLSLGSAPEQIPSSSSTNSVLGPGSSLGSYYTSTIPTSSSLDMNNFNSNTRNSISGPGASTSSSTTPSLPNSYTSIVRQNKASAMKSAKRKPKSTTVYDMTPETAKRNRCRICGKQFKRPSSLQTHYYSHTGEKLFKCPLEKCGKLFSVKLNMTRHFRLHERDILREQQGVIMLNSTPQYQMNNTAPGHEMLPPAVSSMPHNQSYVKTRMLSTTLSSDSNFQNVETKYFPASFPDPPNQFPSQQLVPNDPNMYYNHHQPHWVKSPSFSQPSDYYKPGSQLKQNETPSVNPVIAPNIPTYQRAITGDYPQEGMYCYPNYSNYANFPPYQALGVNHYQATSQTQPVPNQQTLHSYYANNAPGQVYTMNSPRTHSGYNQPQDNNQSPSNEHN